MGDTAANMWSRGLSNSWDFEPTGNLIEYVVEAGEIAATMYIVEETTQNIVPDLVWAMHLLEDLISAA